MRKITTSKPAKPVVSTSPAKPAKLPKLAAKPVASIPAIVAAAPVVSSPAPVSTDAGYRGAARDAAGIVRNATNYAVTRDRDLAYLRFFGSVSRQHNHTATLRQLHDAGTARSDAPSSKRFNPLYDGSAKATDIGAINRAIKAGFFTRSADGNTITATELAKRSKAYLGSDA